MIGCIDGWTKAKCGGEEGEVGGIQVEWEEGTACKDIEDCCTPPEPVELQVPFVAGKTSVKDVGEYINDLYIWLVGALGILAVVMIMVGGVQWMFAAGNVSKINVAKKRISDAFLGLLLCAFSFLILYTINPALVNLEMPGVPKIKPVYQQTQKAPAICEPEAKVKCGNTIILDHETGEGCMGVYCSQQGVGGQILGGLLNLGRVCKINKEGTVYKSGECVDAVSAYKLEEVAGTTTPVEETFKVASLPNESVFNRIFQGLTTAGISELIRLATPCGKISEEITESVVGGRCGGIAENQCYVIFTNNEPPDVLPSGASPIYVGGFSFGRASIGDMQCNGGFEQREADWANRDCQNRTPPYCSYPESPGGCEGDSFCVAITGENRCACVARCRLGNGEGRQNCSYCIETRHDDSDHPCKEIGVVAEITSTESPSVCCGLVEKETIDCRKSTDGCRADEMMVSCGDYNRTAVDYQTIPSGYTCSEESSREANSHLCFDSSTGGLPGCSINAGDEICCMEIKGFRFGDYNP